MIRNDVFQRIRSCDRMWKAGKLAMAYVANLCKRQPLLLTIAGPISRKDVERCRDDLENLYIVRMFAEFETAVRDCWHAFFGRKTHPPSKVIFDRMAARCHIPSDDLDNAHKVRNFRNSLLHGNGARRLMIADAMKYLNCYLRHLPLAW